MDLLFFLRKSGDLNGYWTSSDGLAVSFEDDEENAVGFLIQKSADLPQLFFF